jgi:predicted metal-dependent hydrolase
MIFCLRDAKTKQLHDKNILMYVCIHELAHLATVSIDHDDAFWKNNDFILDYAVKKC